MTYLTHIICLLMGGAVGIVIMGVLSGAKCEECRYYENDDFSEWGV